MSVIFRAVMLLLASIVFGFSIPVFANSTIVIIRHGEKPAHGLGQLSCQGFNRALALPQVLLSRYGTPVAIYATNPAIKKMDKGVPYAYIRPLATIEPLAIRVGLPVNLDWGMSEIVPLSEQLIALADGTVIVAWEHHLAEKLAKIILSEFGEKLESVPEWGDADFDSIYVIRINRTEQGKPRAIFSHEQQNLNDLPAACAN